MCFLLKHNIGDCMVHFGGFDQVHVHSDKVFWQEAAARAAREAGEDICHSEC